ncbi:hypothetical protein HJC23_011315 [Cyclotella cryptica]|uniref:Transmembrane protein n=1 Tax=Cyclotella cryptica TaxID=29204 RepID=A0ABD3QVL6_9STRA|eukprot:CCRYP_001716-RB/>CCRYP_001716-RB protein AED:0.02 eAED:0.02 QI:270/1/1/1/1/1/2/401/314
MDPLYAKAQGKVGGSSSKSSKKSSRKKKASSRSQSSSKHSVPLLSGAGEPTSESARVLSSRNGAADASRGGSDSGSSFAAAAILMNAMHLLDAGLGIACMIYGSMAHEIQVQAVAISLGVVLVLGSLCGALGYCSRSCNRAGLAGSVLLGLLTCLAYIGAFVWVLVSWNSFVSFFDADEEVIADSNTVVTAVLVALALLEGLRIFTTSITRTRLLQQDALSRAGGSARSMSTGSDSSSLKGFMSWLGLSKKKRSEDFVMFDDNASMESSLLWSKDGGQPSADDYLEFVPEHERGLANYTSNVSLPLPPADKTDY